jgi:hypothetical protein
MKADSPGLTMLHRSISGLLEAARSRFASCHCQPGGKFRREQGALAVVSLSQVVNISSSPTAFLDEHGTDMVAIALLVLFFL